MKPSVEITKTIVYTNQGEKEMFALAFKTPGGNTFVNRYSKALSRRVMQAINNWIVTEAFPDSLPIVGVRKD